MLTADSADELAPDETEDHPPIDTHSPQELLSVSSLSTDINSQSLYNSYEDSDDDDDDPDDTPIEAAAQAPQVITPGLPQRFTRSASRGAQRVVWDHITGGRKILLAAQHSKYLPRRSVNTRPMVLRTSMRKAMTDPKIKTLAKEAMRKELLSIHNKKVFRPLRPGEEKGLNPITYIF
jgi:hypothetical protein